MIARLTSLLVLIVAAGMAGPAASHRLNAAVTTLEVNPRSGVLEVVHEVFLHDLDHALVARLGRAPQLETGSQDTRDAVEWLAGQFTVRDSEGQVRPLALVGAERDHDRLIIYRELAEPGPLEQLFVSDRILMDHFPAQINRVNVIEDGQVRTLIFQGADAADFQRIAPAEPSGDDVKTRP